MSDRIADTPIIHRQDWVLILPPEFAELPLVDCFSMGEARIILTLEGCGWHLSISCANRDPTWQEIVTARYRLLPSVPTMMMLLPPLGQYVNIHHHCFHLYEYPSRGFFARLAQRIFQRAVRKKGVPI